MGTTIQKISMMSVCTYTTLLIIYVDAAHFRQKKIICSINYKKAAFKKDSFFIGIYLSLSANSCSTK